MDDVFRFMKNNKVKMKNGKEFPAKIIYCNFCGISQFEVDHIIAGPTVYICRECSELCIEVLDEQTNSAIIKRTLAFPKEYLHAAATILSSISDYVRTRYPEGDANVSISQDKDRIIVLIKSKSGDPEIIERLLSEFGLAVSGKVGVNELPISEVDKLRLQAALDFSQLQLKLTNDTLALLKEQNLRLLGLSERQTSVAQSLSKSIQMSLTNSTELGRYLAEISRREAAEVQILINAIEDRLEVGIEDADEAEVKSKLKQIEKKKPGLLKEVYEVAKDTGASGGGSLLAMWIAQILGLL